MSIQELTYSKYLGDITLSLSSNYVTEKHLIENGHWESHVAALIDFFVKEGNTCVDVGANTGIHTLHLARNSGATGKVFAFEPNPEYGQKLKRNIALNPHIKTPIRIIQKGLSDQEGSLKLFEAGDMKGNAYMSTEYNPQYWNKNAPDVFIECPVTRLDNELQDTQVDFIKIDVEGMESAVMKGASMLIERCKPYLVYETLVDCFPREKILEMDELVRQHGYFVFAILPEASKIVRVNYPSFPEDVVAIHKDKLLEAAPIIGSAVQYRFENKETETAPENDLRVTIVEVNKNEYAVSLHVENDYTEKTEIVIRSENRIDWNQNIDGQDVRMSIELFENNHDIALRDQCRFTTSSERGNLELLAHKVGGHFIAS